jgi:3,2-trans-enoyl-CoA isomerase
LIETLFHDGESGRVIELRLARPPVNALDRAMLESLGGKLGQAGAEAVAIVISGAPGMFSAGLDVRAVVESDHATALGMFRELWKAQRAIACSPVPVIFAITGHCPAGGTVLAIHADYRVMALGDFRLGLNEVQVGLFPGPLIYGAFRRLVGGHAAQLLTRGALVDPATALRVGLVDELCEASQCTARALAVAREICALPREAMSRTRTLVRRDLLELFGAPEHAAALADEFAAMGADMFFAPATLSRLKQMFARKR